MSQLDIDLQKAFSPTIYRFWISHLRFDCIDGTTAYFVVKSEFVRRWVMSNYTRELLSVMQKYSKNINMIEVGFYKHKAPDKQLALFDESQFA